jgi:GAF domain-containing protein
MRYRRLFESANSRGAPSARSHRGRGRCPRDGRACHGQRHAPEALTAAAELQELLLATDNIEDFLQDLAVLAARSVAQGLSCGITLQRDGRLRTVANSDDRAARCDEIQYDQGTGPCLDAMRTREIILVDDLVEEERWGEYRTSVLAHGVRSSLSLPLSDGTTGALNLYATRPRAFGETRRAP